MKSKIHLRLDGVPRFCEGSIVNSQDTKPEATHPDIQEILRKRREMLNRVKADLERVGKLQEDFRQGGQKPPTASDMGN